MRWCILLLLLLLLLTYCSSCSLISPSSSVSACFLVQSLMIFLLLLTSSHRFSPRSFSLTCPTLSLHFRYSCLYYALPFSPPFLLLFISHLLLLQILSPLSLPFHGFSLFFSFPFNSFVAVVVLVVLVVVLFFSSYLPLCSFLFFVFVIVSIILAFPSLFLSLLFLFLS